MDGKPTTWDPGLPEADPNFLTETAFRLTREEARYLNEKVLALRSVSGNPCLLQWIVQHLDAATVESLEAPWSLLESGNRWPKLPASLHAELLHAHHFSLCGRVLTSVYCRFLAGRRRDLDVNLFDELLADSLDGLAQSAPALRDWYADLPIFWRWIAEMNPRLQRDRPFIDEWIRMLAEQGFAPSDPSRLTGASVERWVQARERRLKGSLARMSFPSVLQRWNAPSWVGLTDYRWRTARDIVVDILMGLGRTGDAKHAGP